MREKDNRRAEVAPPTKNDIEKPPIHLLPPEALFGAAEAMAVGAKKYGPRNWEGGLQMGRVFSACMRHMWAWWRGEDLDPETGISHLHHAAACIMMLQAYWERGQINLDDRYVHEVEANKYQI